jgi:hypothetical protein
MVAKMIQGQILRSSDRREAVIFLRDGTLWVADFIDGDGALVEAETWFRFNCGSASNRLANRRAALESAAPLTEELVARIEALLGPDSRKEGS